LLSIIVPLTVDVIGLVPFRALPDKSFENKFVDRVIAPSGILPTEKRNSEIAVFVGL
jgi:hypothetical protein